ncbi:cupin domain-containing protein [Pseudoteredinibacter isoporae]|uniref:Quercetin dioxygenase-like cupin family protein n=1 Tax=Pseudoteredinibacter isoporae TaxID=570281 RepID=A0A7X0JUH5_9GAMM|nr:hypothetical protein [Pseudoteredinibacter isoporae]MBB6522507.1 quercetin dioxygenase-like cupin family protein [Pseudoteredinibacter isoporae]NHO88036.1 hypothetical protein [Pseudoteredinibacter isoporae]NIB23633.1 hypothetical protein [Pseudoteredinibacter isoporae]
MLSPKYLVGLIFMFTFTISSGCTSKLDKATAASQVDDEIDPEIYSRIDDPDDPYGYKYAEFRERRAHDMASSATPSPLPRYKARHRSSKMPWLGVDELLQFDWTQLRDANSETVDALLSSTKLKIAFDHPDLKINQLAIGAGGRLPLHADGAPGMFVVVGGRGTVYVGKQASKVTTGSTVKLEPYVPRSVQAANEEPLRMVWVRWAPGGDQSYIDAGYYLTGSNQHIQPAQANFEPGYLFWGEIDKAYGIINDASSEPFDGSKLNELEALAKSFNALDPLYPNVPVFGHESEIQWLSAKTLKSGGFFFSDDLGSLLEVADKMINIARHKAIFRASRPDGRWDFNFSQSAWGARSTYVEHSHVIPEFYYVLSGPVVYGVDGELYESLPGDILFNNSYSPHLARGIVDGLVFRSFSSTFAPNGDRSVFERPFILLEQLPEQPDSARLPDDFKFHE